VTATAFRDDQLVIIGSRTALGEAATPATDDLRASVAGLSDLAILTVWDERLALGLMSPADYAAAVRTLTVRDA